MRGLGGLFGTPWAITGGGAPGGEIHVPMPSRNAKFTASVKRRSPIGTGPSARCPAYGAHGASRPVAAMRDGVDGAGSGRWRQPTARCPASCSATRSGSPSNPAPSPPRSGRGATRGRPCRKSKRAATCVNGHPVAHQDRSLASVAPGDDEPDAAGASDRSPVVGFAQVGPVAGVGHDGATARSTIRGVGPPREGDRGAGIGRVLRDDAETTPSRNKWLARRLPWFGRLPVSTYPIEP